MRVIHTPANVGNQCYVLSRHERQLGLDSDVVVHYVAPSLLYKADRVIGSVGGRTPADLKARIREGLSAPLDYDVIHYYFGRTIFSWDDFANYVKLGPIDLLVAKALGKPVIFTLQGCDARLAARSAERNVITACRDGVCQFFRGCVETLDARRIAMMDELLPLADRVFYLNPELGHYVTKGEFAPYASVDIASIKPVAPRVTGRPRILHAPSDPAIKGTSLIIAALEQLRSHFDFELVLIQNMTHEEAMKAYREADIAIDQVMLGWYGGFAVEVMAMGKPVMCYLRQEDFACLPYGMKDDLPILSIRPESLVEDIGNVLERRSEWIEWSRRSRNFVEKWHDPSVIAAAMVDIYRDPSAPLDLQRHRAIRRMAGSHASVKWN